MLPPDNRAVLRDLMRPPAGFKLRAAVGTTFTLDLVSALAVPLAFSARDLGDAPNQIGVMQAIREVVDQVDVFYQVGHAQVPRQQSDILAFLEPVLHPVKPTRPGRLFHPKVWVLAFDSDESTAYRVIVTSRNLTADRCWDVVASIDGTPGGRQAATNRPLRAFVHALPDLCVAPLARARVARARALADELLRAEWDLASDVDDLAFHALGLSQQRPQLDFSGRRHLVVSPFVEEAGMATVVPGHSSEVILVARPEHLDKLTGLPGSTQLKVMSPMAELDEERAQGELSGLHAKLTVVERGWNAHMFLGSANATGAAYDGNVEFLLEIVRKKSKYGIDSLLSHETGMGGLLEDYEPQPPVADPDEDGRWQLEKLLRSIAELDWTVKVVGSDPFTLKVSTTGRIAAGSASLTVELLSQRGTGFHPPSGAPAAGAFEGVELADITPFLVLILKESDLSVSTVVPALLVDEPSDRLDAVLARQFDTPEKFLRFLMLLLGLSTQGDDDAAGSGGGGGWGPFGSDGQGVFEVLARALADHPTNLDDLVRLVERLAATEAGRSILPPGFLELWGLVEHAREMMAAGA